VCTEPDSRPPEPALPGAAVSHEDLVLEASDAPLLALERHS